jgi:chaperonin cofactor prefoldin
MTQPDNSKENLTCRMNQTEDRIPGLEDKVEDLDTRSKEYEKEIKI